jgi:hypothetical protein
MQTEIDENIVAGYFGLLNNLSDSNKKALIERLVESLPEKSDLSRSRFEASFGAFESELSADQMIEDIRDSRKFTRETESFE